MESCVSWTSPDPPVWEMASPSSPRTRSATHPPVNGPGRSCPLDHRDLSLCVALTSDVTSCLPVRGQDTGVLPHQVPRPLTRNIPRGGSPGLTQNSCCNFVHHHRPDGHKPPSFSSCWSGLALCSLPCRILPLTSNRSVDTALRFTPGCRMLLERRVPVSSSGVREKGPPQASLHGLGLGFQTFPQINFHP